MVPIRDPLYNPAHPDKNLTNAVWKRLEDSDKAIINADWVANAGIKAYLEAKRSHEMLNAFRVYFDRAIDGHRTAIANLTVENIESVYITSILVSFAALFTLSENEGDTMFPSLDPVQWVRLAQGTRFICDRWRDLVGPSWIAASGVFYGKPDLTDDFELFKSEHGLPFGKVLTWAEDFETMTADDRETYQKALSYIGLIYKGIIEGTDEPLATCRRLTAMPSRLPPRFGELVVVRQPRAFTMLAHIFACMKLISDKASWFRGIAERQVPKIYEQLPVGWREMMAWPMAVANGEVDREPKETQIHDILLL